MSDLLDCFGLDYTILTFSHAAYWFKGSVWLYRFACGAVYTAALVWTGLYVRRGVLQGRWRLTSFGYVKWLRRRLDMIFS